MFNPNQPRDDVGRWTNSFVYHGSDEKFTEFDDSKIGKRDKGFLGHGFYFSTDEQVANLGKHKMQLLLAIENPLHLSMPNFRTNKQDLIRGALGLSSDASAVEITKKLKSLGHDSVVLDYSPTGYMQKEIMVMDAGKIIYIKHLN